MGIGVNSDAHFFVSDALCAKKNCPQRSSLRSKAFDKNKITL